MAKGKGKKGKGKKKPEVDPNALTEVDKTFYELQIADLNKKLTRLRSVSEELQVHNDELQDSFKQLDGDRHDVIIYLKSRLQEKCDEIREFEERVTGLESTRAEETTQFTEKITQKEDEYKQMHEHLTSEIKLLSGKLNALEDFRIQKEALMNKFETQEKLMQENEQKHKRELFQIDRKFIMNKEKLKKDMEEKLIQLSNEFQDATEVRIASTTRRVIRENVAVNNELDAMLVTHKRHHKENDALKLQNKTLKMETQLFEKQKNTALEKAHVQRHVIEKSIEDHQKIKTTLNGLENIEVQNFKLEIELLELCKITNKHKYEIRILEQKLHAGMCEKNDLLAQLGYLTKELQRLTGIMQKAVLSIKVALQLTPNDSDYLIQRESLLQNLFNLMNRAEEDKMRQPSLESIASLTAVYTRGDLGFLPKTSPYRQAIPICKNISTQVGGSLAELPSLGAIETVATSVDLRAISTETYASAVVARTVIDDLDEKLLFIESSEATLSTSSEASQSQNELKMELVELKRAGIASAAKVSEEMKRAASQSATKAITRSSEDITLGKKSDI